MTVEAPPQSIHSRVWNDHCGALRMSVSRECEYSVCHTLKPIFDPSEQTLKDIVGRRPVLFVVDANVARLYGDVLREYVSCAGLLIADELILPVSEAQKTWDQVDEICACAVRSGLPRNGLIVAIGGGVILDTAGLAASVFRRGIGYVRIPTTLVGMIDVAVGIKQGVNAHGRKNLIGAFYPPLASINDYNFLQTLSVAELACGMAEMIKMALVSDLALFETIEEYGRELVLSRFESPSELGPHVLFTSELLMMQQLAPNLFEQDYARIVDFGHTFSPAIESWSNYRIAHGQAVAMDMLLSVAIAVGRGIASSDLYERLCDVLWETGLEVSSRALPDEHVLLGAVSEARRHRGGALNLVVVESPGRPVFLQEVHINEIALARATVLSSVPHAK